MTTATSPGSLARAALAGLTLGLIGAAFIFLYSAVGNLQRDCSFPDTDECTFELESAREVGKLQGFAAIGCALVGGGLGLVLRRR